ncbi:Uma2 family endonuclease [Spirosoma sp. BT702]|uniref:Uma2 family endonuclease n=1 Tax=Spirosoma profusum TaxID=2771354 RepID=A0A926Y4M6_9BACT|nr:Uma2 family endonuclease [Spirosoma profusum]MBD2703296.1 Uma2 family endonuclease [Spirosoma profusum]
MSKITGQKSRRNGLQSRNIPPSLIYEIWNGKPVYYQDYQDVLVGTKTVQEVRSCVDIEGVLLALINGHPGITINRKENVLAANKVGISISKNDIVCCDIVVLEKKKLGKLQGNYVDVAPKVGIDVDTKADVSDFPNRLDDYLIQKSQKLLDFGVEKVRWVITSMQKVYIIEQGNPTWHIVNWSENIQVVHDCHLNIKQLLDEEEITY